MSQKEDFTPKIGRIRARSGGVSQGRSFLNRVLKASTLARGGKLPMALSKPATSRFTGSRIGRGSGVGRVLASRAGIASYQQRRVMVKSRIVRLAGKGQATAVAHMRYLQRDGVTRDGQPGALYSAEMDKADGREFLERCDGDRHQFRFIVSPEDGVQYDDLKGVTRRLLNRMEEDLGTKLDWVAVDHYNTGHPHTHILIRGKDDQGKDLIIARDYVTAGIRERATEIVSLDLGPRSQWEINTSLQAEVTQERFTSIDKQLVRDQSPDGLVCAVDPDAFRQSLLAGRLNTLQTLGLAHQERQAQWRLSENLEPTLRRLGERGDIIKQLGHDLKRLGREAALSDFVIHDQDPARLDPDEPPKRITGALLRRSLSNELEDRHNLLIDGIDGRVHVVEIGQGDRTPTIARGGIVTVEAKVPYLRVSDVKIVEVANGNGGIYDIDAHLKHDRTATQRFAETHIRRLEAIRRATGEVQRTPDGRFVISSGYLDTALEYERAQAKASPVKVEINSAVPVKELTTYNGVTWLDRQLLSKEPEVFAETGFGAEVTAVLRRRQQWLIDQGLATNNVSGTVSYKADLIQTLTQRELRQAGSELSKELGKPFTESRQWEPIEGRLRQVVETASGKYGVVERAKDFTLVPWRRELERQIGQEISGIDRGSGISWEIGRSRNRGLER